MKILLYSIIFTNTLASHRTTDFCRLDCGKDHVVCKRKPCGPDRTKCGTEFKMFPLNSNEREIVTHMHNSFRDKIARQYIDLEPAADMRVMSYSRELEFVAQCWANSCPKYSRHKHDKCRSITGYSEVGQNSFIVHKDMGMYSATAILIHVINTWQRQIAIVKEEWIQGIDLRAIIKSVEVIQMLWAETIYVGCGRARYGGYIITKFIVVCNYAPKGIEDGAQVYHGDVSCSSCPNNCSKRHVNLCGEERPVYQDPWVSPFSMNSHGDNLWRAAYGYVIALYILKMLSL